MQSFHFLLVIVNFLLIVHSGLSWHLPRKIRDGQPWGYNEHNGPDTWEGTCETGRSQSPIDIVNQDVIHSNDPEFEFDLSYFDPLNLEATNNGHSLLVRSLDVKPLMGGGGLDDKYIFEQLHFHWGGSEHSIDGERYDMELHIVHYNSKYSSINEALGHRDGLAVLGVLCKTCSDCATDEELKPFLNSALRAVQLLDIDDKPVEEVEQNVDDDQSMDVEEIVERKQRRVRATTEFHEMDRNMSLSSLLPDNRNTWYRYEGSLTTPSCSEIVTWTVFTEPMWIETNIMTALQDLTASDGTSLDSNYRPTMPLHGRTVWLQKNEVGSGPSLTPCNHFVFLYFIYIIINKYFS